MTRIEEQARWTRDAIERTTETAEVAALPVVRKVAAKQSKAASPERAAANSKSDKRPHPALGLPLRQIITKIEAPVVSEAIPGQVETVGISLEPAPIRAEMDMTDLSPEPRLSEIFAELLPPELPETEIERSVSEQVASPELEWAMELAKEPLEIYEDFEVALRQFAEFTTGTVGEGEVEITGDEPETTEHGEMLPISLVVAERLATLETAEKAAVGLLLKDITGAVHGIKLLEARGAEPEMIAAVELQLKELCVELFESLGIEYDEEMARKFVAMLLDPEFKLAPQEPTELDLEHAGTHEVKQRFALFASGLSQVEHRLQQAIGSSALAGAHRTGLLAAA